jgi:hypothetical protein
LSLQSIIFIIYTILLFKHLIFFFQKGIYNMTSCTFCYELNKIYFNPFFFFFFFFVFLCYTLTIVPSRQSSLVDRCYGIAHTDWSRPNTPQPGICPVIPEKHVKTLDRLVGTISDNHVPPYLPNARAYGNAYKYTLRNTTMLSYVTYPPRPGSNLYKLQVTRHRPRPLSYRAPST